MAINLNNFVNINITYHISSDTKPTREVATLILFGQEEYKEVQTLDLTGIETNYYDNSASVNPITSIDLTNIASLIFYTDAEKTTVATAIDFTGVEATYYDNSKNAISSIALTSGQIASGFKAYEKLDLSPKTYKKLADVDADSEEYNYAQYYFANGGKTLNVIYSTAIIDDDPEVDTTKDAYINILKTLDYKDIVVMSNATLAVSKAVAKEWSYIKETTTIEEDGISAINQKIFVAEVNDLDSYNKEEIQFLVLKYSKTKNSGIIATVAAYLSQINIDNMETVKDYEFTKEEMNADDGSIIDDDAAIKKIIENDLNADAWLLSNIRNIGGNDTAGKDLVNQFMLICLHQTLTEELVQLLTTKVKYNNTGLTLISSVINSELQRYVNNGYLSTNKSWTEDDLVYNGYTVIKKNTPLTLGYKYIILPFSTLTPTEKKNHKLPNIYILISDNYSIRKIEIVGEVY